jgi:hypothetical protein
LAGLDVGGQLASNLPIWPIGQHLANWRPICQLAAIKIWTSGQPIANPIQLGLASNWSPIQMGHPATGEAPSTEETYSEYLEKVVDAINSRFKVIKDPVIGFLCHF